MNSITDKLEINKKIQVLDHGFIRLVDCMGDDKAIVDAARVSYGKGTRSVRHNRQLIRYLLRHRHTSPFEMCEIKLHVSMPIFVARQWIRHRTANVNEVSARYSILPDNFYIPELKQLSPQDNSNKQKRSNISYDKELAVKFRDIIEKSSKRAYKEYLELLGDENKPGLARELARIVLPVNIYTEWYWKIDLHNLLHFVHLRMHDHSQYEIYVYAQAIASIIETKFPLVWEAFNDYILHSKELSLQQAQMTREQLIISKARQNMVKPQGMSDREWKEIDNWLRED